MRAQRFASSRVPSLPPDAESLIRPLAGGALLLAIATCARWWMFDAEAEASRCFLDCLARRASSDPMALAIAAKAAFADFLASDVVETHADHELFAPKATFAAAVVTEDRVVMTAIGCPFARVLREGRVLGTTVPDVREIARGHRMATRSLRPDGAHEPAQTALDLAPGDEVQVALTIGWDVPRSDEEAEAIRAKTDASRIIALLATV